MNHLGIDCGSVSVKMAVLDKDGNILAKCYFLNDGLKTTIVKSLKKIKKQLGDKKIKGVGVTGSGRSFAKILVNADLVKTEILAHFTATHHYFKDARTIIDIGGEDSKLITLKEGIWTNYVLNQICAAGTGSMLVNIANNLDVKMEDIGDVALKSKHELHFPAKCGILCNSAAINYKNKGILKEDILMGVCRALIKNYMLLARNVRISPPYIFQGATAKNKALVKALGEELGEKVLIPKYPELMGAIGMALLCKKKKINKEFDFNLNAEYDVKTIIGKGCPNQCEITLLYKNKELIGSLGNRCENCIGKKVT